MKRRILSLLLAGALSFSLLAACGDSGAGPSDSPEDTPAGVGTPSDEPSTSPENTPEPPETPSDEPSQEPSQTPAPTPTPTPAPTPTPTPAPTPAPTPTPAPAGVDLAAFAETTLGSYEFGFLELVNPDDELGASLLSNYYAGLTDLNLNQTVVYICMMSMNNGEFALVEAGNADDAAAAAGIFQARIDYMAGDGDNPGGAWYPEPTRIWAECSQVVINGNYVMMVVHEQYSDIVDLFNALF